MKISTRLPYNEILNPSIVSWSMHGLGYIYEGTDYLICCVAK